MTTTSTKNARAKRGRTAPRQERTNSTSVSQMTHDYVASLMLPLEAFVSYTMCIQRKIVSGQARGTTSPDRKERCYLCVCKSIMQRPHRLLEAVNLLKDEKRAKKHDKYT